MKNRIREVRKAKKITQEKLVEDLDITRQYISLLEKSEIEPSMKVANSIASTLGTCVYQIFDLDGTGNYKCTSCNSRNSY
jgi:putative transcriptional regulator